MNQQNKKRQLEFGILLCIIVILIFGCIGVYKILNDAHGRGQYNRIREEVIEEKDDETDPNTEIKNQDIPFYVNFTRLKAINEDIIGWLYIPSLEISYPIVQGETNETYLHTTAEKKNLFAGSIFMDMDNKDDFSDPNTLIYGHNMKDGSMFGTLWHIPYQHAADKDPYFWIYTPTKVYKYKIFSAYDTTTASKTYHMFFKRNLEFRNWCMEMRSWSYIDFGEHLFTTNSFVVTLSTCSGTSKVDRTIVQGYRMKEYAYNGYKAGSDTGKTQKAVGGFQNTMMIK